MQLLAMNNQYIPNDLSLISFNNSTLSQIGTVPLSSMTHPKEELGAISSRINFKND